MRVIKEKTIKSLCEEYAPAKASLVEWLDQCKQAGWSCHDDVVGSSGHRPSPVGPDRLVFNIAGNSYRLIVRVDYLRKLIYVHWFGTHAEYNCIVVKTVPCQFD